MRACISISLAGLGGGGADYEMTTTLDFDPGPVVMGAVGYAFPNGVRLEGEVSYRSNEYGELSGGVLGLFSVDIEGDFSQVGLMGNVGYDFDPHAPLNPFVMAGAGVSFLELSDLTVGRLTVRFRDGTKTVAAFQAGAGIQYAINDDFTASVSYRFFGTTQPYSGFNNLHHNGLVGVMYSF
ncbi:MAG: outer membrane beta-barrel protein [Nitrospira sp.]|nr:outer membrane beta-barrel protein [Nitrospira sp.]